MCMNYHQITKLLIEAMNVGFTYQDLLAKFALLRIKNAC